MGQLLLTLACSAGGVSVPNLDYASVHFSPDFVRCLALLLAAGEGGAFSWRHMAALAGERMMMEADTLAMFNENLVGWNCVLCVCMPVRVGMERTGGTVQEEEDGGRHARDAQREPGGL